jgi:hypothetical protein
VLIEVEDSNAAAGSWWRYQVEPVGERGGCPVRPPAEEPQGASSAAVRAAGRRCHPVARGDAPPPGAAAPAPRDEGSGPRGPPLRRGNADGWGSEQLRAASAGATAEVRAGCASSARSRRRLASVPRLLAEGATVFHPVRPTSALTAGELRAGVGRCSSGPPDSGRRRRRTSRSHEGRASSPPEKVAPSPSTCPRRRPWDGGRSSPRSWSRGGGRPHPRLEPERPAAVNRPDCPRGGAGPGEV